MPNDDRPPIDRELLHQQMDSLAREIVGLKPDDRRRAEIVAEMSRLSLLSASMKGKGTD